MTVNEKKKAYEICINYYFPSYLTMDEYVNDVANMQNSYADYTECYKYLIRKLRENGAIIQKRFCL